MKPILLIIALTLVPFYSDACECLELSLEKLDNESYEWAEVIVIGEIIQLGSEYHIEVKENIKGETDSKIIGLTQGENQVFICTWYPNRKGEYLLYLKVIEMNGEKYYYASECLGSRLLSLDFQPASLHSDKDKETLISQTNDWLIELRKRK